MRLLKEDGRVAGLYDVCDWWFENYPADIFENNPREVVQIRMIMSRIQMMRKKAIPTKGE